MYDDVVDVWDSIEPFVPERASWRPAKALKNSRKSGWFCIFFTRVLEKYLRLLSCSQLTFQVHFVLYKLRKQL